MFLKKYLRIIKNKKKYPDSYISSHAVIGDEVKLEPGVMVGEVRLIGIVSIGKGTMINGPTLFKAAKDTEIIVGAFCSIAENVTVRTSNHPLETPMTYSSGGGMYGDIFAFPPATKESVILGSDVWLGSRTIILPGTKIGDGAVVAAGAVVTKDVPPYAIVGGVPARVIRYRFNQTVIDWLLRLKWWEWEDGKIRSCRWFFHTELTDFDQYKINEIDKKLNEI